MSNGKGTPVRQESYSIPFGYKLDYIQYVCTCSIAELSKDGVIVEKDESKCELHGGTKIRKEGQQTLFPVLTSFKEKKKGKK